MIGVYVLDLPRGVIPEGSLATDSEVLRNGRPWAQGDHVSRLYTVFGFGVAVYIPQPATLTRRGDAVVTRWSFGFFRIAPRRGSC